MSRYCSLLIVDNNPDEYEHYLCWLQKVPDVVYDCTLARNGSEGLKLAESTSFDCALVRYSLPDMDGLAVLRGIRSSSPLLPLVLFAEQGNETMMADAIEAGAYDCVATSEVPPYRLQHMIMQAVDHGMLQRDMAKWNEDGSPTRLAGSIVNISRSKKAEEQREKLVEKLAESNELNNAILSSAVTLLIVTDVNGRVVIFNDASEKTLGYTKDEIVGKQTPAIWHFKPEVVKRAAELSEEYGITIKPGFETFIHKPRIEGSESREWTFIRKDGSHVPVHLTVTVIKNNDGDIAGYLGVIEDITKRKEVEQALKASEETFRLAIENASIGMALVSPNGSWLKVNKSLCDLLGYKEQELLSHDFQTITHPDDLEQDLEYVRKTLAGEINSYQMEKRYYRRSGRVVWALLSVSLVRHANGKPNYFISQLQDITERKEMERIKNEFISIVSHELRTPLTSIRGSLDLLVGTMAKDLPEKANRLLYIAQQNSERLILLINDMLDMDKIASGQMRFHITEEALSPLIQQAIATNQPYANKFGVFFVALPIHTDLKVNVDPERLLQVLANLLSNAAKFSNQGDKIEITTMCFGKIVRVMVADHGPGIPEEFRSHVFDKFSQADSSETRVKGGTGLGLHISKQIIERMGGRIGFDAETGKGSTFWIEVPIVP